MANQPPSEDSKPYRYNYSETGTQDGKKGKMNRR